MSRDTVALIRASLKERRARTEDDGAMTAIRPEAAAAANDTAAAERADRPLRHTLLMQCLEREGDVHHSELSATHRAAESAWRWRSLDEKEELWDRDVVRSGCDG